MNTTVQAAGLLLMTRTQPRKFLLMQHADRWDLPKGHAEAGESLLETALRETQEETGIANSKIEIQPNFKFELEYDVVSSKRGQYRKRVTYFLGWVDTPLEIVPSEHLGFSWFEWPVRRPIQSQTIDPLLASIATFLNQGV